MGLGWGWAGIGLGLGWAWGGLDARGRALARGRAARGGAGERGGREKSDRARGSARERGGARANQETLLRSLKGIDIWGYRGIYWYIYRLFFRLVDVAARSAISYRYIL